MYEISTDRPIPTDRTRPHGLTKTLRGMHRGDSIVIPQAKKSSAYSAAKQAGARITIRDNGEGDVIVWRVDGPERLTRADIFGE